MKKRKQSFLMVLIAFLVVVSAACQSAPAVESQGAYDLQITQIDTTNFPLVDVYISVRDKNGEPQVINTSKLQLLENGVPVQNQNIQGAGEVGPLSTILLIDNSGSMNFADKLKTAKTVAKEYIDQMRPGDQVGVITFNTQVQVVQDLTTQQVVLKEAIDGIRASNDTALVDALVTAINILNPVAGRKAIIALTDGMDNQSTSTPDEALAAIGFGGLSISTIGFGEIPESGEEADLYSGIDENALRYIAQNAGGRYGYAANQGELSALYDQLRRALQSEVVISYTTPLTLRDGVLRGLTVTLSDQYSGVGGASQTSFNPGGLVPEVAQPASWLLFFGVLAGMIVLLLLPVFLQSQIGQKSSTKKKKGGKKKKIKITLKD